MARARRSLSANFGNLWVGWSSMKSGIFRELLAEWIGTFGLCFIGYFAAIEFGAQPHGILVVALAYGFTIAALATALAPISGAHFNPAVTAAMLATKRIEVPKAIAFFITQIVGALSAAALSQVVHGPAKTAATMTRVAPQLDLSVAFLLEVIGTFFLVLSVFGNGVDTRAPRLGALLIGITVTAIIFAIGPTTNASLNPARTIGPAIILGEFSQLWLYCAAPILGGLLAALAYHVMNPPKPGEVAI